jgi:hypothetical protein
VVLGQFWDSRSSPRQIGRISRYVVGPDAKATYATRLQLGDEAFRKAIKQQFLRVASEGP